MNTYIEQNPAIRQGRWAIGLLFLAAIMFLSALAGCGGWKDFTGPPMVIDASKRQQDNSYGAYAGGSQGYVPPGGYQPDRYGGQTAAGNPYDYNQQGYVNGASGNNYGQSTAQPMNQKPVQPGVGGSGYAGQMSSGNNGYGYYNAGNTSGGAGYNVSCGSGQIDQGMRVEAVEPIVNNYPENQTAMRTNRIDSQAAADQYNPNSTGVIMDQPRGPAPQVSMVRVSETGSEQQQAFARNSRERSLPLSSDSVQASSRNPQTEFDQPSLQTNTISHRQTTGDLATPSVQKLPAPSVPSADVDSLGLTEPAAKISTTTTPPTLQPTQAATMETSPMATSALPRSSVQLNDLMLLLEQYIERDPDNVEAQLALRFLYQAYGLEGKATEPINKVPMDRQAEALRLAKTLLLAQQASGRHNRDNPEMARQAMEALEQLTEQVSANADLEVNNLRVCKEGVRGFGQYTELDMNQLTSGLPQTVWIYFELENFQVLQDEQGKYSSKVSAEITLYDDQFRMVKQLLKGEVPDESYSRRRDFFLVAGPLKLPALSAGKYQLVVSVEDKIAGKAARPARFEFEVKPDYQNPK